MKKTILFLPLFLFLIACGGKDEDVNGTWEVIASGGVMSDKSDNFGDHYTFKDNTLTVTGKTNQKGSYEMKGDTLIFSIQNPPGETKYIKEMKDGIMVLKTIGAYHEFQLEKQ